MKFVVFSDLHLDAQFSWAGREIARRRRQALRDTLTRIVELTKDIRADALLCGGDLYEHERFSPDTEEFVRRSFAKLSPIPVLVAPGNHDWLGPASLYRRVDWTPNVHVFEGARLEPYVLGDGLTLWGAAHRAPVNTDGFLRSFSVDRGGVNLALFHGSERGFFSYQEVGKQPYAPFTEEELERSDLDHAFLGHFHRPRDAERYTYPGNPDPLTFGEDGERGVVIATISEDGGVTRERRKVGVTTVHDLILDVTGCCSSEEVRSRVRDQLSGLTGVARVTIEGELAADVDLRPRDLADMAPFLGLSAILPRFGHVRVGYDFNLIAQEQTVRGQFVRDVRSAQLPEAERDKVLAAGLRALDKREDLEVA